MGQRCSSVIIPGSGRGALRPPLALLPGLAGEAGQRGSPLSAPPPPAGPGHCAKGPKAPRTLVTRATGDSVQHGLLEPPANQGETRETGPLLHAPRHPPAATTSTGLPALRGHPTHPGRVGMADPQSTGPLKGGVSNTLKWGGVRGLVSALGCRGPPLVETSQVDHSTPVQLRRRCDAADGS